jgi:hypothetical protein
VSGHVGIAVVDGWTIREVMRLVNINMAEGR